MTTATLLPDLPTGFALTMADTLQRVNVGELSAEEVSAAIQSSAFLRDLFAMARRSIEGELSEGVDARAFAARYERAVLAMDALLVAVALVVEKARASQLPTRAEEFVAGYQALGQDIAELREFLGQAVAKAKAPFAPIDRKRVQEAAAAYDRGETRPL